MPNVPENKARLFYLYIMCICNVYICIFNNKDTIMTQIFIFAHFGLNIHHSFLFCYLERISL